MLVCLMFVATLLSLASCAGKPEPALPAPADAAEVARLVVGNSGREFLRSTISTRWDDGGRRAAELFGWIPRDAESADRATATRAGETAQTAAAFLADEREQISTAPANPQLWRAFAHSVIPYLHALVGDNGSVVGFASLDDPASQMRRTTSLFAAMTTHPEAARIFTDAATSRAVAYEAEFAKAAVAEPLLADRGPAKDALLRAARLRALVATGAHLAHPESATPSLAHAQTQLAYQVASLTARPDDRHIDEKFFKDGRLLAPSEIAEAGWSIYDAQLTVYLSSWPRINDAIGEFGRAFDVIAGGQQASSSLSLRPYFREGHPGSAGSVGNSMRGKVLSSISSRSAWESAAFSKHFLADCSRSGHI